MTLAVSSQSLSFNHINCSVVQGFPALRKAIITQVKKYDNFPYVFVITNLLLTCDLPFAPLCHLSEWMAKPLPFSIQGPLWKVSGIMVAKSLENVCHLQKMMFKIS